MPAGAEVLLNRLCFDHSYAGSYSLHETFLHPAIISTRPAGVETLLTLWQLFFCRPGAFRDLLTILTFPRGLQSRRFRNPLWTTGSSIH